MEFNSQFKGKLKKKTETDGFHYSIQNSLKDIDFCLLKISLPIQNQLPNISVLFLEKI